MTLFNDRVFVIVLLLVCQFLINFSLLLQPMLTEADAYSRFQVASYRVMPHEHTSTNGSVWLPLHEFLLAPIVFLFPHSQLAPRLFTFIFASSIPLLIFALTKTLTKNNFASFFTALCYILFPLFGEISVTTLTEPFFLGFFLASLYFFVNRKHTAWVILLLLCQMIRFEAWFVTPFFILAVGLDKLLTLPKKLSLVWLLICFPLYYSVFSYIEWHNPFLYYTEIVNETKPVLLNGVNNWPAAISDWSQLFKQVFPFTLLIGILVGAWQLVQELNQKSQHWLHHTVVLTYLALPLFLLLMLPIQEFFHLRDWLPVRYLLVPLTCSFPLLGLGFKYLITAFSPKKFFLLYLVIGGLLALELFSLRLNANMLLRVFAPDDFAYLQNEVIRLREKLKNIKNPEVIVYNPHHNIDFPTLDSAFLAYFLLPVQAFTINLKPTELFSELHSSSYREKIVVAPKSDARKIQREFSLVPLIETHDYVYLVPSTNVQLKNSEP